MLEASSLDRGTPIAISYRPKSPDYLPAVVGSIRRFLGDWPIVLLTEKHHLPPREWLSAWRVEAITDWAHSVDANKILRLWEHQEIFAAHFDQWIWWHDDMLLLRHIDYPSIEFDRPRVRHGPKVRPNKKLPNWHNWLWDTLGFFECLSIAAPNPVLHVPRLIQREALQSIPPNWNKARLLFEPTYLLWHWHCCGQSFEEDNAFRTSVFKGAMPDLDSIADSGAAILNWGKGIDPETTRQSFAKHYLLNFSPPHDREIEMPT